MQNNADHSEPYFDLNIRHISTNTFLAHSGSPSTEDRVWWFSGWFLNLPNAEQLETDEWCESHPESYIGLAIEDEGVKGDGIFLNIDVLDKRDKPDQSLELASVRLSPAQAKALAIALLAAVLMREGQGEIDR